MKRVSWAIAVAFVTTMPATASAIYYGTAGGCRNNFVGAPDEPLFFANGTIFGINWSCNRKGLCLGDGRQYTEEITIDKSPERIIITFGDGRQYTLPACDYSEDE